MALSLQDLPELALMAIQEALWEHDADGFCPSAQDAAVFRMVCKRLHDAARLPDMLKLSYSKPIPNMSSLGLLLSKPAAAGTRVCLHLEALWEERHVFEPDQTFSNLMPLGSSLISLSLPCNCIRETMDDLRRDLPHLQHIILRLTDDSMASSTLYLVENIINHNLHSLTLSVPPGSVPFEFFYCRELPLLDLSAFTGLQHVVLQGPIVHLRNRYARQFNGGRPFILPPKTKVTIDPGLHGRKPTPWARCIISHEFAALPGNAVPHDQEYREEDLEARQRNKLDFFHKVVSHAVELNGDSSDRFFYAKISGFADGRVYKRLDDLMALAGCYYQSYALGEHLDFEIIAEDILKEYRLL